MKKIIKIIEVSVSVVVLILLILWLGGFLTPGRIEPGKVSVEKWQPEIVETLQARRVSLPIREEAVGTVRPETEATISAQTSGRILSVAVRAGDVVSKGDALIRLDDREVRARVDQARRQEQAARAKAQQSREALAAAQAQLKQAESQYNRIKAFHAQEAATTQQLEEAESAYRQALAAVAQAEQAIKAAEADVARAGEAVREAQVALGYTLIVAPVSGEVSRRLCEPGDLAWPGKPLLAIQSQGVLRLEANVRESLIDKLPVGTMVPVVLPAANKRVTGTVDEVVPSADAASRTFLVKVRLTEVDGLYPGMFGRLIIAAGTRETVLVPERAVQQVGQLKTVVVHSNGNWERRFIRTGSRQDDQVEVLSGLEGGEQLGVVREQAS